MPTNTGGGTTTSFTNTPQAQGDSFSYSWLTEDWLGVYNFDVMANDLGGNAKILWSVDDGTNSTSSTLAGADLLTQDTVRAEALSTDTSKNGAKIWITSDGKVGYDSTTLSTSFKASLQGLAAGETLSDTFIYAIRLSNGTLSWTTVTVVYQGTNDAPVVSGAVAGSAIEDGAVVVLDALKNSSDVDHNTTLHVVNVPATLPPGVTYDATSHSFSLDPSTAAYQHLAAGQTTTVTVNYGVSDGTATTAASVTWTITGTNDAPVAHADTGAGTENQVLTINVLGNDTDVDDGHSLSLVSATAPSGKGTASVVGGQVQFDPGNAFDHLSAGATETVVVSYTMQDEHGATSTSTVTITVTGTNDAAVITGDASGSVTEASGVLNGTAGVPTATGDLDATDVDSPAAFVVQSGVTESYGTFSIDATGAWSYTVDDSNAAVQALNTGQHLTETVTVATADGTEQQIQITINGANDAAVITGDASGSVTEASGVLNGTAGVPTATGDLDATDVDSPAAFVVQSGVTESYGTFSIDATGAWSYTVDDSNAAVQALNTGQHLTETVTVATADGTEQQIQITINGANDAAVITGDASGSVTEASGVLNGTAGVPTATGDLDATDVDSPAAFVVQSGVTESYGTFSIDATGAWSYTVDDSNAAVQALNTGQHLTETVTVATADGTEQQIQITINGANDAAVITGDASGSVTEASGVLNGTAGVPTATGDLDATDVDSPAAFVVQSGVTESYGTFSIDATGAWSYTVDDSNAAVQALNTGQHLTETVTVATADGTEQQIQITINGANDAAVITGDASGSVTEASGVLNGTAGVPTATGDLDATDVDSPAAFVVQSGVTESYGTFSIDATGAWSYTVDDSNAAVQALNTGQHLTETVTVATADGTEQQIQITINGANDAAVITGDASGSVTEASGVLNGTAGVPTATGDLDATDVDSPAAFVVQSGVTESYGTFSIDATGAWSYTVDDSNAAVQALNTGQHLTETVTVATADGTEQQIQITINGANDAAVITGDASGSVTEASGVLNGTAGVPTATGDLDATDVDSPAAFVVQSGVTESYGTFSIDATGAWSYTVDDSNAAVQALNTGQHLTETVTVATADGTEQQIQITINGANDAAVITGDASGSVTEASGVLNGTAGVPTATGDLDATDVDSPAAFVVQSGVTESYGTFSIDATGAWSYTVDDSNAAVQALNTGQHLTETVTVATADGTEQQIQITINGANDAAVITGDASGSVTEASGVLNGTAGVPTATGDLDATDVDSPAAFVVQSGVTESYGTFSIDATGAWSYTVDDSNAAVQALNTGQHLTETVTVATADGTEQQIQITINGANDAAVITGDASGSVTEASGVLNGTAGVPTATGDLDATDVDSPAAFVVQSGVTESYGTFSIDATGAWSYTVDDSNAAVQALNTGQHLTETVTVATADGTEQQIQITINGANDAAVITGDASGSVTEASGVLNGTAGVPTATGDLDATDVDSPAAFVVQSGVTESYGTFSIDATGAWSYTVDDSNAAVQALNTGQHLTETVTVATADGTEQQIQITINGANDAAVITGDASGSVTEASGVLNGTAGVPTATGDLDATDVDSPAAFVVQSGVTESYGTFSIDATGAWSYTVDDSNAAVQALNTGQHLTETVTVATADGTEQQIQITINGANDAPTASATDSVTTDEDTASSAVAIGAGDVDDDAVLSYALKSGGSPAHGSVSFDQNAGTFVYTPAADYHGGDSFTIVITDNRGATTEQVVSVTVNSVNDNPVANPDSFSTNEDTPVTFDVRANDTDVDGDSLSVTQINGTAISTGSPVAITGGSISLLANGSLTFTPNANFNGTPSFNYTISDGHGGSATGAVNLTVNAVNDAPVNTLPATFSTNEDTVLKLAGLSVTDVDAGAGSIGVTLSVATGTLTAATAGGVTVSGSGTGSITLSGTVTAINTYLATVANQPSFAPAANTNGNVTLTMTTSDNGNSGAGGTLTDTDTSTITVNAVNDAPVLDLNGAAAGTGATLSYTAGAAATAISPAATITDIDSPDFGGGSITVAFTGGTGTAADQLTIQNQGTGAGQIGVSGSNVTFGGVVIGTFTGGANGSSLVISFNANATQAAAQALAEHVLYSDATSGTTTKTLTYTLVDGDGTANGGSDTSTATATINVTGGGAAPVLDLNGAGAGNDATFSYPSQTTPLTIASTATVTDADSANLTSMTAVLTGQQDDASGNIRELLSLSATAQSAATAAGLTVNFNTLNGTLTITGSASVATYQTILDGIQYADTKTGAHTTGTRTVTITASDGTNTSVPHTVSISVAKPAGAAGSPINLALDAPDGTMVTVHVKSLPDGWSIAGAVQQADGSWLIQTTNVSSLTVTTPSDYSGAEVLAITATWANADGSTGIAYISDNVEAYAPGAPIFAWSGDDTLTGSSDADMFVFSQPIGRDVVHSFDTAADTIDLIGYGLTGFGDVQAHMADDASGNAVITLGDGQTITLDGVSASLLTEANFLFDVTPTLSNSGTMTIGDGALLPLSGTVNNSGTISLDSHGATTVLQLIQNGVTLQGGGHLTLSDNSGNVISGSLPTVTFTNVDNVISGAGQLGGGSLILSNGGTILADGFNALVIDTGANAVLNSGTIEATGLGGLQVVGSIVNDGLILAQGGSIAIGGDLTGSGHVEIDGNATVEFGGVATNDIMLDANASGVIVFDHSSDFSGAIWGLNADDQIDLRDLQFGADASMTYADNGSGDGVLTISDGTHSVQLHVRGNYSADDFTLGSDGHGGILLTNDIVG